ncbi:MAG TPA: hypothetical protein VIG72_05935, partial [Pontibacter sp.]
MKKLYFLSAPTGAMFRTTNVWLGTFLLLLALSQSVQAHTKLRDFTLVTASLAIGTEQYSLSGATKSAAPQAGCHVIDFENVATGFISSIQTDAGEVSIFNRMRKMNGTYASENHASIFNTLEPTGDDLDLYTWDWGHVLIINQDLHPEPNDNPWGGEMILDFSAIGPVTMTSLKALDIDPYENNSWVYLYDGKGNELHKVQLQSLGNMSQQTVDLGNTKGVMKMVIKLDGLNAAGMLAGSGAIDDIRFCVESEAAVPDANAGADKLLTCAVTEVTLEGSSTTAGVTYTWSGPDGFTSSKATPTVNKPGTYTLTVTDPKTGASASDTVVVAQDIQKIGLDITRGPSNDYITCNNDIVVLWAGPDRAGLNFEWTGPNGFTSDQPIITVSVLGTYTLTATDPVTGCSATTSANVWAFYPTLTADAGPDKVLTCKDQKVILEGSISGTPFSHWYKDGKHVTFGSLNLEVNEPGTYVLKAIDTTSGCTVTDTVVVTLDNQAPNLEITRDPGHDYITCNNKIVKLQAGPDRPGLDFEWTGPNGFTSDQPVISVSVVGTYTLTATDPVTGCSATASAEVWTFYPTLTADAGQDMVLTCKSQKVTLQGSISGTPFLDWYTGDGKFIQYGNPNLEVNEPGTYVLRAIDTKSGCIVTDTVVVTLDNQAPAISA